ncbi:hypothetical protein [Streptomyces yanii]|uniref:Uncharacterized protein n=1 Tax=Streptomyces yanii TaxID=78510 RepID=A0ABV5RC90_9ACTN
MLDQHTALRGPGTGWDLHSPPTSSVRDPAERSDPPQPYSTLCEAVVARTGLQILDDFITPHLPEPPGARVLGCILQLDRP